jgi:MFS family permease
MAAGGANSYSFAAYGRLLRRNPNYRRLWFAQVVSEMGDWLYVVAVYSLLLELTGQAKYVGFAVVLQLLPQVLASPVAGALNDRISRRAIMIFADICRVFIVLSMLLVTTASMVWLVWILLFLETVMWALFEPGRGAIIPNLVADEDELLVANALSSTTWAINFAIGSGIGGLIAYRFGRETLFVLNALSFVVSALLLSRIKLSERHVTNQPPFRLVEIVNFKPVVEGFRYIRRDGKLIATMMVKAGMGLIGAHWVILPLYGQRIFPLDSPSKGRAAGVALSMSLLMGSRGIGSLFGSFSSGYFAAASERRMRAGIFWAFILAACAYSLLSAAPTLALACAAVALGHAGTSVSWVFSTTMLQTMTEDSFRGRVLSADYSGLFLVMSVTSFTAGQMVDWGVPVRTIALVNGLLGLIPAFIWLACQRLWKRG